MGGQVGEINATLFKCFADEFFACFKNRAGEKIPTL
jgi:hypothetical protein